MLSETTAEPAPGSSSSSGLRSGGRCVLIAQIWAVGMWVVLFGDCINNLFSNAIAPFQAGAKALSAAEWIGYFVIVLAIWLAEGVGAFQRSFSPMLIRRTCELGVASSCFEQVLGPFFVAGLFAATPKRLLKSWALMAVLVPGLALTVPYLSYPWRPAVDMGVVLGLGWGTASMVIFAIRAFAFGRWPQISPDMPASRAAWPEAKPATAPLRDPRSDV
eukprot:TRINITY_DN76356_c0_g1_i2.p1 TRINITY_DN76356_c0_g1~~TRINITY_DN76356_c0_g1_i2.p1  ORF type:complete len:243 (+),score=39.26 TRINITY_DN76356_c0_g1_i2:76-729(+)